MRVLLLGGNGLIGRGIATQLLAAGHEVTVFHRGTAPVPPGARSWPGERTSVADLRAVRDSAPFDAVVDMVCFDADQAGLAIDVFGGRVAQWVHCSTVDVYRKDSGRYPLREDAERSASDGFPYARGKLAAEHRLEDAAGKAFDVTLIRPAATYLDAAVAPVGSFALLLERLRGRRPIVLPGDGSSIWASAHRDDVAAAFVGALGTPRALNRAYHVAGEELLTWREYWRTIGRAIGVEPDFVYIPTDVLGRLGGDDAAWCVQNFQYDNIFDCTAARRDLGYRYRVTWEQGVAAMDLAARPVDAGERVRYERLVEAWLRGEGRAPDR